MPIRDYLRWFSDLRNRKTIVMILLHLALQWNSATLIVNICDNVNIISHFKEPWNQNPTTNHFLQFAMFYHLVRQLQSLYEFGEHEDIRLLLRLNKQQQKHQQNPLSPDGMVRSSSLHSTTWSSRRWYPWWAVAHSSPSYSVWAREEPGKGIWSMMIIDGSTCQSHFGFIRVRAICVIYFERLFTFHNLMSVREVKGYKWESDHC